MTTVAGFYVPGDSWLHRLDPRVKLWFTLLGVSLCILTDRLDILIGVITFTHFALLTGGVPSRRIAALWRGLGPLILVILILQPIFSPGSGPSLWRLGPMRLTQAGLLTGLRYALRVAAAAFVALTPVLTTPINILVRGLHKTGLPYTWGMTIGLALRYLGTIGDLYETISEAQQARGWDLSRGGLAKRAKAAIPTLVALIIASLRLGDSLALGLAARGFGLNRQRTYWRDIALRPVDWAVLLSITGVFIGTLFILR